jgi:hypothetical protein
VGRTVTALEELSRDQLDVAKVIQKVCFKYVAFIIKLLMRAQCYPDLIRFKGLLPRLVQICGDEIDTTTCDECKLLEQLAGIAEDSDDRLHDDVCTSVFVTTTFQQCPCYLSFVHNRGKRAFNRAHAADTDAERLTLLEPMRDLAGMPQELITNFETAIILCQSDKPKEEIAEFIFSHQPQAALMAAHWHPTTAVGAIGRLVQEKLPEFDGVSYDVFAVASAAIVAADILSHLTNPLAKQAIAFVEEGKHQPQACVALCASALHARIGTKEPQPQANPADIDENDLASSDVYKRIKAFLPKTGKQPDWWVTWKAAVEKEAAEKGAKKAEKPAKVVDDAANEAEVKATGGDNAATGGGEAAVVVVVAAGGGNGATGGVTGEWEKGQCVQFVGPGKKQYGGIIDVVNKEFVYVVVDSDQGKESNKRKRIPKKNLTAKVPEPPANIPGSASGSVSVSATATGDSAASGGAANPEAVAAAEVAAKDAEVAKVAAAKAEKKNAAWNSLGSLFADDGSVDSQ